jgi:hypothetical protein
MKNTDKRGVPHTPMHNSTVAIAGDRHTCSQLALPLTFARRTTPFLLKYRVHTISTSKRIFPTQHPRRQAHEEDDRHTADEHQDDARLPHSDEHQEMRGPPQRRAPGRRAARKRWSACREGHADLCTARLVMANRRRLYSMTIRDSAW